MIATHLSDDDLAHFLSGRLPEDRFELLMKHLDDCANCQQRASASPTDDSFAAVLSAKSVASDDAILSEVDCQAALFHAAGPFEMPLDRVLPPIDSLGPYRLIRPLGRGGMGAVYLARHDRLQKQVAIKLLPRHHGFDAAWRGRFEREMQAVARLSHVGIVTATDAGDVDGWHYLVMEYLDGLNLAEIIERVGKIDTSVAASIMRDVCQALACVHQAGLVHRDIKPSNIMLTHDGSVKLLDLGLVLDQSESMTDLRLTTVGHVIGTLAFAAPEQLSDGPTIDARADLYSVGATLFQLLSGRTPHVTDRGIAPLVIEKTSKPPADLRVIAPDIPPQMTDLVSQLLSQAPADRPQHADEVAQRLGAMATNGRVKPLVAKAMRISRTISNSAVQSWQPVAEPSLPPPPNRHGWKWVAAAAGAAFSLAAIVIIIQMGDRTIRIETTDPNIDVAIEESVSSPARQVDANAPEKLFKGKPLEEWADLMLVERDIDTLGDAMRAIAMSADAHDVSEAQSILIAARRFGGWAAVGEGNPSERFMNQLIEQNVEFLMPQPGIEAITRELDEGNEKSWAASLFLLNSYNGGSGHISKLSTWANEPDNRRPATELHRELKDLLHSGKPKDEMGRSNAKGISLLLAIALDAPLEDEPELREDIGQILAAASEVSVGQQLEERWSSGKSGFANASMSIPQFMAANELGIELPITLHAAIATSMDPGYRELGNETYLAVLRAKPKEASDALLLHFPFVTGGGMAVMGSIQIKRLFVENESFWFEAIPIVSENTTRPDIWNWILRKVTDRSSVVGGGMGGGGMGGMGGGPFDDPFKLSEALKNVIEASIKWTQERMEAESIPQTQPTIPEHLQGGGMF